MVGLFTCLRRPGSGAAQALLILSACFLALFTDALLPGGSGTVGLSEKFDLIASRSETTFVVSMYTLLFPSTLLRFALVFPRPKPIVARHPWLAYAPYLAGLAVLLGSLLPNADLLSLVWIILALVGTILALLHSAVTLRDAVSRAQLRWGIGGSALGLALFLLVFLPQFGLFTGPMAAATNNFAGLGVAVMGFSLATAILRYRLFDIDVIIRRTLIYALLTTVLASVYLGAVIVFQAALVTLTGQRQAALVTVLSMLLIAGLFTPLHRRIQAVIDPRFYRRKYDAARTLANCQLLKQRIHFVRIRPKKARGR